MFHILEQVTQSCPCKKQLHHLLMPTIQRSCPGDCHLGLSEALNMQGRLSLVYSTGPLERSVA